MKKSWGLRIKLIFQQLALTLVPLLIFAGLSQRVLVSSMRDNLEGRVRAGLEMANTGLTLVLEGYQALLNDFCTDPVVIRALERYGEEGFETEDAQVWLEERMKRICNRDDQIAGIAVFLPESALLYHDGIMHLSEEGSGEEADGTGPFDVFQVPFQIQSTDGEVTYLFALQRQMDVQDVLGIRVALYLEEQVLQTAMGGVEEDSFLLEKDGVVVSAPNWEWIGTQLDSEEIRQAVRQGEYRMESLHNELTGCSMVSLYCISSYLDALQKQRVLLTLMCVLLAVLFVIYSFFVARPLILSVDNLLKAMKLVGKGDYSVRLKRVKGMPVEMMEISAGFNAMAKQTERLMEQAGRAAMEQRNAEISALEAQIDPHFLYNTLDTINWKAIAKEEYEISEMVGDLADILRYAIKDAGGITTLGQEIAWLKKYVRLQQEKLGCEIQIFYEVTEESVGTNMHKMLLQPLVENSIRHGLPGNGREPVIVIAGKVEEGKLLVTVGDNGKGIDPKILERLNDKNYHKQNHFGIENVRKRLRLYYGDEAGLYFRSVTDQYTRVTLYLPVREGENIENNNCGRRGSHSGWPGRNTEETESGVSGSGKSG